MNTANDVIDQLQRWYASQCDGEWEHTRGVRIDSLDNPGWSVEIDLLGTELDGRSFDAVDQTTNSNSWLACSVRDGRFVGHCGPHDLGPLLSTFLAFAHGNAADGSTR